MTKEVHAFVHDADVPEADAREIVFAHICRSWRNPGALLHTPGSIVVVCWNREAVIVENDGRTLILHADGRVDHIDVQEEVTIH